MRVNATVVAGISIILILAGVLILPEVIYRGDQRTNAAVLDIQLQDRKTLTERMLEQGHLSQRNLTSDYTFWDDMISFADRKLDDQWGDDNLKAGIVSFHVNGIWVVDRHGKVRYGVMATPDSDPARNDTLPIPLDIIRRSVAQDKLSQFYMRIGDRTFSVMAAGIVPTADVDRATPPQGYFLTLHELDAAFIGQLGEFTGTTITLSAPGAAVGPTGQATPDSGTYTFSIPLTDNQGHDAGALSAIRVSGALNALIAQSLNERATNRILFGGIAALMATVLLLLNRARARAEGLAATMTLELREANAQLERRVSERTAQLQRNIEELSSVQIGLRERTKELETMNMAMVDRELRIVELKKELEKFKAS